MNNQPTHILNKIGILSTFSIAKRISEKDIQKYFIKHSKKGIPTAKIHKMFIEKIENDILKAVDDATIPGIIKDTNLDLVGKLPIINKLIVLVAHKIMNMSLNKFTLCYIINTLVNLLNLTEDDFDEFHKSGTKDDEEDGSDE